MQKMKNNTCCNSNQIQANSCCNHTKQTAGLQTSTVATTTPSNQSEEKLDCCESETNDDSDSYDSSCTNHSDSFCSVAKEQSNEEAIKHHTNEAIDFYRVQYTVSGMDCGACAKTIEKSVANMEAVQTVEVQFGTAKMNVAAKNQAVIQEIPRKVAKLGYKAEEIGSHKDKGEIYFVEGMDCGACAKTIEKHMRTIPNVQQVTVNFSTSKMDISHSTDQETIISEVKKAGYNATLASKRARGNTAPAKLIDLSAMFVIISGLLLGTGVGLSFIGVPSTISNVFYGAGMVISGYKPVKSAYFAVKSRALDMNVLMSVAAIGAALIGEWLEGALVVWLFSLGALLQIKSIDRTRNSVKELMELAPLEALVKRGQDIVKVSVEAVTISDIILVKPGDRIPLDGEIVKGESSVNQASITGESIPVDKTVTDDVFAGTVNGHGTLEIEVTKLAQDTTIAKIIEMVEDAQGKQAPSQAFIDKFASIYTPIVFVVALIIMVLPPLVQLGTWGEWFYRGLELLVIACPCALVISTPVAIVAAIGNAAKNGVLIKGGAFLEKAGTITAIAFDKTGTITAGKPTVSDVEVFHKDETALLQLARTLEAYSNHPIAKSIVDYTEAKQINILEGENFQSIVGKGVSATIDGTTYYAGNRKLFNDLGVEPIPKTIDQLQEQAKTIVIIGNNIEILGVICVEDTIRTTTVKAMKQLENDGMKEKVMLTGDNEKTAAFMAKQSNMTRYYANLLPEDKVTSIKKLQQAGYQTAMVGDGINDAPALATADLGIAMGGAGTDTAIETADVVLMADNLEKLPFTMKLSKKALTIIKQNVWFSVLIKVVALVLVLPGWFTLWLAVLSDTGAALLVILNSLRLFKLK
ncbi:cadmium-transporting ATPase [Paraliobacillus ryukyuensis]|uniref:Cd(2+)-exporting ATPase n=1 Tax=Paraliobacillus ryukyuensis TaxID=200904 RepID=A0A366EJM1_9BACI|nr:heavy metal translocating P-type ATPase [Paraliobacillus ryukyuensis]RBP01625.1 Cd2+/Zn2+-exporting ATPase [Paraliobacillus ryukyuensis]